MLITEDFHGFIMLSLSLSKIGWILFSNAKETLQKISARSISTSHKLRSINVYDDNTDTNNKRKIFINQSLCPYYRKLYGLVKDLNNEGLINSFWIAIGTIKFRKSSRSKPISITHESGLLFWGISISTWSILILPLMWWGY